MSAEAAEEELQAANAEIQRLRDALSGKERQESQLRQSLSEANADRARLRQSLEEAQRSSFVGASANCIPCEIRSIEEQIGTVQRRSGDLMSETMAPSSRKPASKGKREFDNRRYFIVPKGKGDATCRSCGDAIPRPNYNTTSMHTHLRVHHAPLWEEAKRNAEATGKAGKKSNGGVKKPKKVKPRRRVVIESDDEEEPYTSAAAAAPPAPVEDPQMGRRGTLEPTENPETH